MNIAHRDTMNRVYKHMKYVYDATRPLFLAGRGILRRRVVTSEARQVLEVGCGTARNLILLARLMPHTSFVGIEISSEMASYARNQVAKHNLQDRISIFEGELDDFIAESNPAIASFDAVLFSYSLSMIPDWARVLDVGLSCVAPQGGRLLIADFGNCTAWPGMIRRRLYKNLAHFHVYPRTTIVKKLNDNPRLTVHTTELIGGYGHVLDVTWNDTTANFHREKS